MVRHSIEGGGYGSVMRGKGVRVDGRRRDRGGGGQAAHVRRAGGAERGARCWCWRRRRASGRAGTRPSPRGRCGSRTAGWTDVRSSVEDDALARHRAGAVHGRSRPTWSGSRWGAATRRWRRCWSGTRATRVRVAAAAHGMRFRLMYERQAYEIDGAVARSGAGSRSGSSTAGAGWSSSRRRRRRGRDRGAPRRAGLAALVAGGVGAWPGETLRARSVVLAAGGFESNP